LTSLLSRVYLIVTRQDCLVNWTDCTCSSELLYKIFRWNSVGAWQLKREVKKWDGAIQCRSAQSLSFFLFILKSEKHLFMWPYKGTRVVKIAFFLQHKKLSCGQKVDRKCASVLWGVYQSDLYKRGFYYNFMFKIMYNQNRLIKWFQTNFVLIFIFKVLIFEFSFHTRSDPTTYECFLLILKGRTVKAKDCLTFLFLEKWFLSNSKVTIFFTFQSSKFYNFGEKQSFIIQLKNKVL
jgi:hypothetical protein